VYFNKSPSIGTVVVEVGASVVVVVVEVVVVGASVVVVEVVVVGASVVVVEVVVVGGVVVEVVVVGGVVVVSNAFSTASSMIASTSSSLGPQATISKKKILKISS